MRIVFLLYLILNPLFYWLSYKGDCRSAQELFFQISSMAVIFVAMYFKSKLIENNNLNKSLSVFGLWLVFAFVFGKCQVGWSVLLNVFLGLGVYFAFIKTVKKEELRGILKGTSIVVLITTIYLVAQAQGYDPIYRVLNTGTGGVFNEGFTDLLGTFGIKAHMGCYFAIILPLFLAGGPLSIVISILFFVPLFIAKSTGAILAAGGSILFYTWFRKRILFWIMIPILILGFTVFLVKFDNPMGMQKTRLNMWAKVTKDAFKHPVSGHGLDSFRTGSLKYFKESWSDTTRRAIQSPDASSYVIEGDIPKEAIEIMRQRQAKGLRANVVDFWDHPHNEFIWLFFELGMTGLVILGFILFNMWARFKQAYPSPLLVALMASFVAILLCSTTQFPLHVSRLAHIIPILLGCFHVESERDENINTA